MHTIVTSASACRDIAGTDKVRFDLQCRSIKIAKQNGWDFILSDGSSEEAREHFKSLGADVHPQDPSVQHGEHRRRIWRRALEIWQPETRGMLWMEEKPYLLEHLPSALDAMDEQGAQAVIPTRDEASWESWPELQRYSEPFCNFIYNKLFGNSENQIPFDPTLGPLIVNRDGLKILAECNPSKFGARDLYPQLFAPILMGDAGMKVIPFEVHLTYPPEQRAEEELGKFEDMLTRRVGQLNDMVTGWRRMKEELLQTQTLVTV